MTSLPSIHGCTPADLQNMGMTALFLLRDAPIKLPRSADSLSALECGGSTPLSISPNPEPGTLNPEPSALTPLCEPHASVFKSSAVKAKRRRPRSKIARLPEHIQ